MQQFKKKTWILNITLFLLVVVQTQKNNNKKNSKMPACGIPNTLQHQTDFSILLIPSEVKGMPASGWEFSKMILPVVEFAYPPGINISHLGKRKIIFKMPFLIIFGGLC